MSQKFPTPSVPASQEPRLVEVFVEGEQWKVEAALRNAGFAFVVCPTEFSSLAELERIRDDNEARNVNARAMKEDKKQGEQTT